jgi:hypothetical protein
MLGAISRNAPDGRCQPKYTGRYYPAVPTTGARGAQVLEDENTPGLGVCQRSVANRFKPERGLMSREHRAAIGRGLPIPDSP